MNAVKEDCRDSSDRFFKARDQQTVSIQGVAFNKLVNEHTWHTMEPRDARTLQPYFDSQGNRLKNEILPEHYVLARKYGKMRAATERHLKYLAAVGNPYERVDTCLTEIMHVEGLSRFQKLLVSKIALQELNLKSNLHMAVHLSMTVDSVKAHICRLVKGGWIKVEWDKLKRFRQLSLGERLRLINIPEDDYARHFYSSKDRN